MKRSSDEKPYVLGTGDDELARLGLQHQLWLEQAASAWERARFNPGHALLDVGCGPGHATFDLSRRVGHAGSILAVDRSERFIRHLRDQARARGVTNISAAIADVESLDLAAATLDGAYARWVLCFVARPDQVLAGVAHGLKPGRPLVVQDYFRYESITIAPTCPVFEKVFHAVAQSWRLQGGNPDIGQILPKLMTRAGFEVTEIRPLVRTARPGSLLWNWPDSFFRMHLNPLVEMGLIDPSDSGDFLREWEQRCGDPSSVFLTPPMVEVIGVKI